MRFLRLHFVAWGPFSDSVLDLSGGNPYGFHVIHGRNEAGKSTALRGLVALLYGIAERTPDGHSHPGKELCIRARLEAAEGTTLDLTRRKRRKDSLRDANDQPLPEAVMTELLGGLSGELFQTLFGLDHERLRSGGQSLLEGRGDVGESLFDAGMGGRGIHRVLEELRSEADKIFKPRAKHKPLLNAALESYREAMRHCRESVHAPEKWQEQKEGLERHKRERDQLIERRRQLHTEYARLSHLRAALEPAARRRQRLVELGELGAVPKLAEDCEQRRRVALDIIAQTDRDLDRVSQKLVRCREDRASLRVPSELLALSEGVVSELRAELAVIRSQRAELPAYQAQISAARDDALAVLKRLGRADELESVERLRLTTAEQARLRQLIQQRTLLGERLAQSENEERRAARARDEANAELERLPAMADAEELRRLLGRMRSSGDAEARKRELTLELAVIRQQVAERLKQLSPFDGPPEKLLQISVPAPETVERFARQLEDLSQQVTRASDEFERLEAEAAETSRQIKAIEGAGDVPSEEQLLATRARRDEGWRLIRKTWQRTESVDERAREFDPDRPLADAFEQAVISADDVADRLRREAHRVTQLASLRADLEHTERRSHELGRRRLPLLAKLETTKQSFRLAFQAVGFEPLSPQEMRGWLARYTQAIESVRREQFLSHEVERLEQDIVATKATLSEALCASGLEVPQHLSVAELLESARNRLDEINANRQDRQNLQRTSEHLQRALSESRELSRSRQLELARWQRDWESVVRPLALGVEASSEEVQAVLDELTTLFVKVDDIASKQARVQAVEQASLAFAAKVQRLVAEHAPDLAGSDEQTAAREIVGRHARALAAAMDRERLDVEIQRLEQERSEYVERRQTAEADLQALLEAASVQTAEELELLEKKAKQLFVINADLERDEASLSQTAHEEGLSLAQLLAEVEGVDPATVRPQLEDLKEELDELDEQCRNAAVDIAELERGLHLFADERAVEAAQEAQVFAAQAVHFAERYGRLRLASLLLERQVEQYRESNQGPIVGRASQLFSRLTLGRYTALHAGVEERVLRCSRQDGQEVEVDGLSDGTRDQLYLALRLASLEQHLHGNDPMPLVLDDVLIHFDEERVGSALAVLAELAKRTQILYFTHHARHVELARAAVPHGLLFEHELDAWRRDAKLAAPTSGAADARLGGADFLPKIT